MDNKSIETSLLKFIKTQENLDNYYSTIVPQLKDIKTQAYINLSNEIQKIKELIINTDFLPLELSFNIVDEFEQENVFIINFQKKITTLQSKYLKGKISFIDNVDINTSESFIDENINNADNNKLFLCILSIYDEFVLKLNKSLTDYIVRRTNQNNNFYTTSMNEYNVFVKFNNKFNNNKEKNNI
ncbi:hypothetical protein [Agathobacter rectalis]|uniref:Uncharacterized protein n=1 Tax=Agathobacter rectalis TaxID=39491 RepID=A0A3E4YLE6_9FIRM|nr:hypothetical protein [Agathobacter rectalis]RGM75413.1 hypothetical protein DXB99_02515 [Agathobacter rectalis]